jgi:reactive intermediate/imine deaminase
MSAPIFMMAAGAPNPVAPFSHAVEVDGWVFVTGQMPNVAGNEDAPLPAGVEDQTRNVMTNLTTVLEAAGLGLEHILVARIYLTHFKEDYAAMNAVYESYFEPGRLPARTCIGVTGLALNARVEIDLLARRPDGHS